MLCSIYQWLVSAALDGDKPLGRLTKRHVGRCPRCGEFWRASAALDQRLRVDSCAAVPAGRRSPGRVLPLPGLVGRALLAATALAAIILLAVLLSRRGPHKPVSPAPAPGVPTEFVSVRELEDYAAAPARAEMNHLARDTRDAARVLLSYLPTNADQITNPQ